MRDTNSDFRTPDIALAAYLILSGYSLHSISQSNRGRATFLLQRTPDLDRNAIDFVNRRASVEPLAFLDTLKTLKAMASSGGLGGHLQ